MPVAIGAAVSASLSFFTSVGFAGAGLATATYAGAAALLCAPVTKTVLASAYLGRQYNV